MDENVQRLVKRNRGILKFARDGYAVSQLEAICECLTSKLDIELYLEKDMRGEMIMEIRQGMLEGLDVEIYAKSIYDWHQMREIRLGLEGKLDVSIYANPMYSYEQMQQIRMGMMDGIDVSSFSSLMYTPKEMKLRRIEATKTHKPKPKSKTIDNTPQEVNVDYKFDKYGIKISKDYMTAHIVVNNPKDAPSSNEIRDGLFKIGIVYGVMDAELRRVAKGGDAGPTLIAQGTFPDEDNREGITVVGKKYSE